MANNSVDRQAQGINVDGNPKGDGTGVTRIETPAQTEPLIDFGILLLVNNQPVALRPASEYAKLKNRVVLLKLEGRSYKLTQPIRLGSLNDFDAFLRQYNVSLPKAEDFPAPLDAAYRRLTSLELTVEEFEVTIPGTHKLMPGKEEKKREDLKPDDIELKTDAERGQPTFVLAVTVQWKVGDPVYLLPGTLAIQGFYCRISRE